MIQVAGKLADVPYRVVLTGKAGKPVEGSKQVSALVREAIAERRKVLASPTGPLVQVTATSTDSILHLLARSGPVTSVSGDAPDVAPVPEGSVQ